MTLLQSQLADMRRSMRAIESTMTKQAQLIQSHRAEAQRTEDDATTRQDHAENEIKSLGKKMAQLPTTVDQALESRKAEWQKQLSQVQADVTSLNDALRSMRRSRPSPTVVSSVPLDERKPVTQAVAASTAHTEQQRRCGPVIEMLDLVGYTWEKTPLLVNISRRPSAVGCYLGYI